jgi:hypothetical protein
METSTLQKHLVQQPDSGEKRLYVLDESFLASTGQVHEFVNQLHANDRVLCRLLRFGSQATVECLRTDLWRWRR